MLVLAIDTALAACSVAVIDTALAACSVAVIDTARGMIARESVPMVRGQAEVLMPMVARVMQRVMQDAGVDFHALDRIAVTVGPGSFTGLRVGISAARGIALAASKPAIGVTTLAAFAAPLVALGDATPIVAAVDARHRQVYVQVFGPDGQSRFGPRIASLDEAIDASAGAPVRIVGSGASRLAEAWPTTMPSPIMIDPRQAPEIEWVARLGVAGAPSEEPPKPLYLRAPDAKPQNAMQLPRRR